MRSGSATSFGCWARILAYLQAQARPRKQDRRDECRIFYRRSIAGYVPRSPFPFTYLNNGRAKSPVPSCGALVGPRLKPTSQWWESRAGVTATMELSHNMCIIPYLLRSTPRLGGQPLSRSIPRLEGESPLQIVATVTGNETCAPTNLPFRWEWTGTCGKRKAKSGKGHPESRSFDPADGKHVTAGLRKRAAQEDEVEVRGACQGAVPRFAVLGLRCWAALCLSFLASEGGASGSNRHTTSLAFIVSHHGCESGSNRGFDDCLLQRNHNEAGRCAVGSATAGAGLADLSRS